MREVLTLTKYPVPARPSSAGVHIACRSARGVWVRAIDLGGEGPVANRAGNAVILLTLAAAIGPLEARTLQRKIGARRALLASRQLVAEGLLPAVVVSVSLKHSASAT